MNKLSRDQRRRKKLAARQLRLNCPEPKLDRDQIAEAVHRAVCEIRRDDGFGHCADYAVAGASLISSLTKHLYMPQVGNLLVSGDPEDPDLCMCMKADKGGLNVGEFHAWIIGPLDGRTSGPIPADVYVVDFASRFFRRWVESAKMLEERIPTEGGQLLIFDPTYPRQQYLRPDMPYVWCQWRHKPDWIHYSADGSATQTLWESMGEFKEVTRLAIQFFRETPVTKKE